MGQLGLTEQDYTWITQRIGTLPPLFQGAHCFCLEGGCHGPAGAAWKRICACWLICDVFPGVNKALRPGRLAVLALLRPLGR